MELWKEMIVHLLTSEEIQIVPSNDVARLMEDKCYQAIEQIRNILRDDSLLDSECFMKIEEIISAIEELGSGGGYRHDY